MAFDTRLFMSRSKQIRIAIVLFFALTLVSATGIALWSMLREKPHLPPHTQQTVASKKQPSTDSFKNTGFTVSNKHHKQNTQKLVQSNETEVLNENTSNECTTRCRLLILDRLSLGELVDKQEYRLLTSDMAQLVLELESAPRVIESLAIAMTQNKPNNMETGEQEELYQASIQHILRQLSFNSLSHIGADLLNSNEMREKAAGIELISMALKSNVSNDEYADKEVLTSQLKNFIYSEDEFETKLMSLNTLANHAWQDEQVDYLSEFNGVFSENVEKNVQYQALESIAVFGGGVVGFEDAVKNNLSSNENSAILASLNAIHQFALFNTEESYKTTQLREQFKSNLLEFMANPNAPKHLKHRANNILNTVYK